jgi:F-type H+-transporting ATPase subunit delta
MKGALYSSEIAEPYAQALMSLAQSQHLTTVFGENTRDLLAFLDESPDLETVLSNPVVKDDDKKAILRQILGSQVNPYLLNFMFLLVDKRRIVFLRAICEQYQVLLRKLTNTVLAEVVSVLKLTDSQRQAVIDKVKQLTGASNVEIETAIDPDILGGVIIKVGSQVFDSSLKGQLRRISLSLSGAI